MAFKNKYNPLLKKGIQKVENRVVDLNFDSLVKLIGYFEVGQMYRITDFRMIYDQRTAAGWVLKESEVEPLLVTALTESTLSPVAYSQAYPQDIIYYDINDNLTNATSTDRPGNITYRKDTINNIVCEYDFRHVLINRYEVIAPTWVSGSSYTTNMLVEYNSMIYLVKLDIASSLITPDLDIDTFKYLDIYYQDLIIDGYGGLPNSYAATYGVNNQDYLTFTNSDNPLVLDTKVRNVYVGLYEGMLPDVIFIRTYDKITHSEFSNIVCKNTRSLTVMQGGLQDAIFESIVYGALFSWGNPISYNVIIKNSLEFKYNNIINSKLINSRVTANTITSSEIYEVNGNFDGLYLSTIISGEFNIKGNINSSILKNVSLTSLSGSISNCNLYFYVNVNIKNYDNSNKSLMNISSNSYGSFTVDITFATYIFNVQYDKELIRAENNIDTMLKYYDEYYNIIFTNITD